MKRQLTIMGDRQHGKTYACIDIAIDAARQGHAVLYQTQNMNLARNVLAETEQRFREQFPWDVDKVWMASNNYRLSTNQGGNIYFTSACRTGGRAISVHTHIIDDCGPSEFYFTAEQCVRAVLW